jgi:hypothetical protein
MKATAWEFEARALIFGLIFGVSFPLYYLDQQNSTAALSQWMAGRLHVEADAIARLLFWAAAVLLVLAAAIRTWASSFLRAQVVYASEVKTEVIVGRFAACFLLPLRYKLITLHGGIAFAGAFENP